MTFAPALRRTARIVLDFALPPRCAGCGAVVPDDGGFCAGCWASLEFLGEPCCAACGVPFDRQEGAGARCGACLAGQPPWDSARAAVSYGEVARNLAMRLKYGRRTSLAKLMARHMAARVPPEMRAGQPLVVPVPLYRWRLWSRGFNQSLALARHVAKEIGGEVDPFVLTRTRATRPLRAMSARERARQVRGAFAVSASAADTLRGRTVLLIDDVHTSGATATACTKALRAGGAAQVHLLCWARVLEPGADG